MDYMFSYTSVCYTVSVIVTITAVWLTCILEKKLFRNQKPQDEKTFPIENVSVKLSKTRPLVLANKIRDSLPQEIQAMEKMVQQQQLAAIYELMQRETMDSLTQDEMQDQLKLYGY